MLLYAPMTPVTVESVMLCDLERCRWRRVVTVWSSYCTVRYALPIVLRVVVVWFCRLVLLLLLLLLIVDFVLFLSWFSSTSVRKRFLYLLYCSNRIIQEHIRCIRINNKKVEYLKLVLLLLSLLLVLLLHYWHTIWFYSSFQRWFLFSFTGVFQSLWKTSVREHLGGCLLIFFNDRTLTVLVNGIIKTDGRGCCCFRHAYNCQCLIKGDIYIPVQILVILPEENDDEQIQCVARLSLYSIILKKKKSGYSIIRIINYRTYRRLLQKRGLDFFYKRHWSYTFECRRLFFSEY